MLTGSGPATSAVQPAGRSIAGRVLTFPAVIAGLIVGKAYWACRGNMIDTDLWWHLRNGEYIALHRHLPDIDSYSFTASGANWIDHSWLSELIYYSGYRTLGLRGVFVMFAISVAVLAVSIFRLCIRRTSDPLAAGVAAIFGVWLAM